MAWQFVKLVRYPALDTYSGEYGGVIVEFKTPPDQIPFMDKLGEWLADRVPAEAAKEGVTPLKLRVAKDTDPTWWTTWQVEFWGHGSPMPLLVLLPLLPLIIKGVIALGVAFFSWQVVKTLSGLWQATPQELEREEGREEFIKELIDDYGLTPEDAVEVIEGTKAPPAGIELPEIPVAAAVAAGIGGVAVIGLIAVLAMSRRD
ncbi:hypothetical protein ES707_13549 [subsurface metagenome]